MSCVSQCEIPDLLPSVSLAERTSGAFVDVVAGAAGAVGVSPYWRMSDEEREVRREYSRRRYQDSVIRERMKRHQYLKCLKSGLIQKPSARTLSRRDGEYSFVQ